jgi:tetratricopeptide (TPR) repeat protein
MTDKTMAHQAGSKKRRLGKLAMTLAAGVSMAAIVGVTQPTPVMAQKAGESAKLGAYLAARVAGTDRDLGAAVEYYDQVLMVDPDNPEILSAASLFMLADGQVEKAINAAEHLLEYRPDDGTALLLASVGKMTEGDYAGAAELVAAVPLTGINRLLGPLVEAWVLVGLEQVEEAFAALEKLSINSSFAPMQIYHTALIMEFDGRFEDAEEQFQTMLEGGVSSRGIEAYGGFMETQGRADEAARLYQNFLAVAPDDEIIGAALARQQSGAAVVPLIADVSAGLAEAFQGMAASLSQENALNPARNFAQLALYLRPDLEPAMTALANTMEQEELWPLANEILAKVPADSAYSWSARMRTAVNLGRMDEVDAAAEILEQMAGERPDGLEALISLGDIMRSAGRFDDSVAAYDRAVDRIEELSQGDWVLLYTRGTVLERSGNWERAEADFLLALELEPDQPFVLNYLGYSWVEMGRNVEEATEMIERAVAQRPTAGFIVDSLGWGHYMLGNYEEAVRQLERAVQLTPGDSTINEHLGDAYWRVGRKREATFQWQHALDLGPEEDQLPIVLKKLEQGLDI